MDAVIKGAPNLATRPVWDMRTNYVSQGFVLRGGTSLTLQDLTVMGPARDECFTWAGENYCNGCMLFMDINNLPFEEQMAFFGFLSSSSTGSCMPAGGGLIKNNGGRLVLERVELIGGASQIAGGVEVTVDPLAHWIIGTGLVWSTGISTTLAAQTARSAQAVIAYVGRGFGIPDVTIRDTAFRGNYASKDDSTRPPGGAIDFAIAGQQISGVGDLGVTIPTASEMLTVERCVFEDNVAYTPSAENAALRVGTDLLMGAFVNTTCGQTSCDCASGTC